MIFANLNCTMEIIPGMYTWSDNINTLNIMKCMIISFYMIINCAYFESDAMVVFLVSLVHNIKI